MVITRQYQKIIIDADESVNMMAVQKVIDYINILEIVAQNQGTEQQASELASSINKKWWLENSHQFVL
jgi:hypothetical protein